VEPTVSVVELGILNANASWNLKIWMKPYTSTKFQCPTLLQMVQGMVYLLKDYMHLHTTWYLIQVHETIQHILMNCYLPHSNIPFHDSTQFDVLWSSNVQLDKGCINDVLLVLDISANLLSIYQICHFGDKKIVQFSTIDVVIW
jgi:hypothetical protein